VGEHFLPELQLRWLGTPEVRLDGDLVQTDRRKALALLAYLTTEPGLHRRDSLATFFWGDFDQSSALAYLRRTLWEINRMVGPGWVLAERDALHTPENAGLWVDVKEFDLRFQKWKTNAGQPVSTWLSELEKIVECYRGDFLSGFSLRDSPEFDSWQTNQAEVFRVRFAEVLQTITQTCIEQAELEEGLKIGLHWVGFEPMNEYAHRALMTIYARLGQRATALRQYERCIEILKTELGISPEPQTVHLFEQIRAGEMTSQKQTSAIPESLPKVVTTISLPATATQFVGREEELLEVTNLLQSEDCRLLTLTGPGGTGKTRLAIQAATQIAPYYPDGVYFVPLAPLENEDSIVLAMANAVGFSFRTLSNDTRPPEDARGQLIEYLQDRNLLMVTDNWEHLVHGSGILGELLAKAPNLTVLATSRERLNLSEEWLVEVHGLSFPSDGDHFDFDQYSAYRLFFQTARRRKTGFDPDEGERAAIARICQTVQGIPLAIELAASWVLMLSCQEIDIEISRNLDFLASNQRDLVGRHRSLRAVFDHSWNLLNTIERDVFMQLTVFQGGFTREAAMAVANANLTTLAALVDKSLLNRTLSGRYDLHEMLKQYAFQQLNDNHELAINVRQRHFDYYRQWLFAFTPNLTGAGQKEAVTAIRFEFDNVRRAWEWGIKQQKWEELIPLAQTLFTYLLVGGRINTDFELFNTAEKQIRISTEQSNAPTLRLLFAFLLAFSFTHYMNRDEYEHGLALGKQALDLFLSLPESLDRAWGLLVLDFGFLFLDSKKSLPLLQESLALFEQYEVKFAQALCLNVWARLISYSNEDGGARAEQLLEQALGILKETGDRWASALILSSLARMINFRGDYQRSRGLLLQAMDTYEELGDQWRGAEVRFILGQNATWVGHYDEAREWFRANLDFIHRMSYPLYYATNLDSIGYIEFLDGNYDLAEQYYQKSLTIYQHAEDVRGIAITLNNLGDVARMRQDWVKSRDYFRQAYSLIEAEKDNFELDSWIRSIIIKSQGRIALIDGDLQMAESYFKTALQMVVQIGRIPDELEIFVGLAKIEAAHKRVEDALEILAFVSQHSATAINIVTEANQVFGALSAGLPEEIIANIAHRAQQLTIESIIERWIPIHKQPEPASKTGWTSRYNDDYM
jgi:predicted ATPase/DNA-binding SARP family transcriptional activator